MTVTRIKIFGERNTGTNFVENLVRDNLAVGLCPGNLPRILQGTYNLVYRALPYPLAFRLVEGDRDRRFAAHFDRHAGWKHARTPNLPAGRSRYPDGLGFIAVVKDPYAWLLSLHRRPYQGVRHSFAAPLPFAEFLRAPWPTVGREHAPAEYPNPVRMWNDKVAAYDALHAHGPAMVVAYERVIEDIEGFVREAAATFGLEAPARVRIRSASTKKDDSRSTEDIVRHYRSRDWAKGLSAEDLAFIDAELDQALRERFGYPRLQAAPPGPA